MAASNCLLTLQCDIPVRNGHLRFGGIGTGPTESRGILR
jgi:hypothetical protein